MDLPFSAGEIGNKMKHKVHLMGIRTLEKNGVEKGDGGSSRRSGVERVAIVNKVVMDGLTEKPYKHRLEGAEAVSSHLITRRSNAMWKEEEHVQRPQNMGRPARMGGRCSREGLRGNIYK